MDPHDASEEQRRPADATARKGRRRTVSVNIARRSNIEVAANVGGEGGIHIASSAQHAPIEQHDGQSEE
ncbi:MAG: hypothetical protein JOZ41_11105 [Chloroflexi bacterium]|nr:hypothetical protein [Chloroflexota bacterium]